MPIDETPKLNPLPPRDVPPTKPADNIVSVNDVGRRSGNRAGPFLIIGGIAGVVLIGGLMTVNVIHSKLSGPKPQASSQATSVAGLRV